jgi:hypothetical protein
MSRDDRVRAVVEFGFTERQARFLVTVMLHTGVCLQRQYAAFAGIVHGQKTRKFFDKLVSRGYASAYPCRHNRGRVYHVHHKPLYRAIGQADSRHRRPMSAARVVEALVLLDALLASPSIGWLATQEERAAHLAGAAGLSPEDVTHVLRRQSDCKGARTARDRMPIGVDPSGRLVLLYVVAGDQTADFRWFVQQHAALLAMLPAWTLRVVFPSHLACLAGRYDEVARNEFTGLRPELVRHLRRYFEERRAQALDGTPVDDAEAYDEAHCAFAGPRFQVLYRRWLSEDDAALEVVSATAMADAVKAGSGRVECSLLPFSYRHLSPLVASPPRSDEGAEDGEDGPALPRPPREELIPSSDHGVEVGGHASL